ncbi:hypothetical protein [Streptacidiphilus sp. EB129]|uniref:hypothetical protein n=1 Tax=Streptacidiphilus sp. EB129 TaxID=3156262 RepID=UPI003512CF94
MSMQFGAYKDELGRKARAKVKDKVFAELLTALSNDEFFTDDFLDNHVVREEPSPERAEEIAQARNKPLCTLLFLPGTDFGRLADDVREAQTAWQRKPPRLRQLFFSSDMYTCITVTRISNGALTTFQAGDPETSRIQYAVTGGKEFELKGSAKLVYPIGHLETSEAVGSQIPDGGDSDDESVAEDGDDDT